MRLGQVTQRAAHETRPLFIILIEYVTRARVTG